MVAPSPLHGSTKHAARLHQAHRAVAASPPLGGTKPTVWWHKAHRVLAQSPPHGGTKPTVWWHKAHRMVAQNLLHGGTRPTPTALQIEGLWGCCNSCTPAAAVVLQLLQRLSSSCLCAAATLHPSPARLPIEGLWGCCSFRLPQPLRIARASRGSRFGSAHAPLRSAVRCRGYAWRRILFWGTCTGPAIRWRHVPRLSGQVAGWRTPSFQWHAGSALDAQHHRAPTYPPCKLTVLPSAGFGTAFPGGCHFRCVWPLVVCALCGNTWATIVVAVRRSDGPVVDVVDRAPAP